MHVIWLSSERALSSYRPIIPRAVRRTSSLMAPRSRNLWGDSSRAELLARTPRVFSYHQQPATTASGNVTLQGCAIFALQRYVTHTTGHQLPIDDCVADCPYEGD